MPDESLDVILKGRFSDSEVKDIKSACYDLTQSWGRTYTISDFLRDACCIMRHYYRFKDVLIHNHDVILPLLERLSNRK